MSWQRWGVWLFGTGLFISACVPVHPLHSNAGSWQTQALSAEPSSTTSGQPQITASPTASPTPTQIPPFQITPQPSLQPTPWPEPSPWSIPTPWPEPTPWPVPSAWPVPPAPQVMGIQIDPPTQLTLTPNQVLRLHSRVSWTDTVTSYEDVRWESTVPEVASVDAQGKVTAHLPGTVEIRVFAKADERYWQGVNLEVQPQEYLFNGKIAYIQGNDVYVMTGSNLNPRRVTQSGATQVKRHPRLSWSGCELVYGTPQRKMYRVSTEQAEEPRLVNHTGIPSGDPMPYLWYNQEVVFRDWADISGLPQNQPFRNWNTVQGLIEALAGITPLREVIFEQNLRIKYHRFLFDNRVINRDYGPGRHPRIAQRSSPTQIVYEWNGNIQSVPFNEGPVKALTQTPEWEDWPSLSTDERAIVYVAETLGQTDLWLMNADGSERVNLTQTPHLNENFPDWGPVCAAS